MDLYEKEVDKLNKYKIISVRDVPADMFIKAFA